MNRFAGRCGIDCFFGESSRLLEIGDRGLSNGCLERVSRRRLSTSTLSMVLSQDDVGVLLNDVEGHVHVIVDGMLGANSESYDVQLVDHRWNHVNATGIVQGEQ